MKFLARVRRHRLISMIVLVSLIIAAYGALVLAINAQGYPVRLDALGQGDGARVLDDELVTVTTWNIGYAGLGADADFKADGGQMILPPSGASVDRNLAGIVNQLTMVDSDVLLMQEVAGPSMMTRGRDVLAAVNNALAGRNTIFSPDMKIRFVPPPLSLRHGLLTSVNPAGPNREIIKLPLEPGLLMGLVKRDYHMQVTRLASGGGAWSFINIHLSAFDDGANVRLAQLRAVFAFAEQEYANGRRVVIGGDWNFEFSRPGRPSTTSDEFLFWLHRFPLKEMPSGWQVAIDASVPTVRTNERAYRRGENFTTVIDGFIVSPNVEIIGVTTTDLDFQFTDHQYVTAQLRALSR